MRIVVTGVGGQGVIFLTRMLGEILSSMGKHVISTEIRGMSQMLGTVTSYIKVGNFCSPDIAEADVIIGLEMLETLRHAYLAAKGCRIISNTRAIHVDGYPKNIERTLKELGAGLIDASGFCEAMNHVAGENMVLLGAFCRIAGITKARALSVIKKETKDIRNIRAFGYGYSCED